MCTLYSITTNQDAIKALFRVTRDSTGNLPSMPSVFPDWEAPVIRGAGDGRELVKMRWGLPNPPQHGGINTNIRNPTSPHWRRWLKPENRCLVPANSFSEYNDKPNPASLKNPDGTKHEMAGKKDVVWFALDRSRPVFSFAGIWMEWAGARGTKSNPIEGTHLIYAFLTCPANGIVAPVHAKAMPVILTTAEEHTCGCARRGMKPPRYKSPCPTINLPKSCAERRKRTFKHKLARRHVHGMFSLIDVGVG